MMPIEEAIEVFHIALKEAIKRSDAIPRAIEIIRQGGWVIEDIEVILYLEPRELKSPQPKTTDADFLREMHIVPDMMPRRRKHFGRWPTKRRTLVLLLVFGFSLMLVNGCANIRVDLGCQSSAPTVTNAPSHTNQKHPVCGLQK